MNTNGLTHFDEQGQAIMVDVSGHGDDFSGTERPRFFDANGNVISFGEEGPVTDLPQPGVCSRAGGGPAGPCESPASPKSPICGDCRRSRPPS